MGINSESEVAGNLQIGPTTDGMVRIYVSGDGVDLPMDFDPEDAEEIAEELRAAAAQARAEAALAKRITPDDLDIPAVEEDLSRLMSGRTYG